MPGFALISDGSDVRLAADLSRIGAKAVPSARAVVLEVGEAFRDQWKANAAATAGVHGKHYPDSIDADLAYTTTSIAVEVGPNPAKPQGGMSFEFGSRNQPPHLDGARAFDVIEPRATAMIESAIGRLFG